MAQDLEWIINWGPQSLIIVMLVMFFKDTQHSLVSWGMMGDLDGTEPYPAVMVWCCLFFILSFVFHFQKEANIYFILNFNKCMSSHNTLGSVRFAIGAVPMCKGNPKGMIIALLPPPFYVLRKLSAWQVIMRKRRPINTLHIWIQFSHICLRRNMQNN